LGVIILFNPILVDLQFPTTHHELAPTIRTLR
jgi:hypothetical protein